jgi:HK97 family phage major capsid protein
VLNPNSPNVGFQDYTTLGNPHSVSNDLGNAFAAFGAFSRYRLYRRAGLEVRWVDGGLTLARKNLVLLVCRARFGGRVVDPSAFAKIIDAQA